MTFFLPPTGPPDLYWRLMHFRNGDLMIDRRMLGAVSTPLASIFGSGFLVIVPILAGAAGKYALPAMAAILALAYAVGWVIRSNIRLAEPSIENGSAGKATLLIDRLSDMALVPAYVISVCLYIRILSSFLMNGLGVDSVLHEKLVTTAVILAICLVGAIRGLKELQRLESRAIWVTMGIIAIMIAGFAVHDLSSAGGGGIQLPAGPSQGILRVLAVLGGTLICVQGFETSRYLGEEYDRGTRIRSCRWSQVIAAAVYLVFIAAATPLMRYLSGPAADDALVSLARRVSPLLPVPLIAAAVLSQFSAAVADTLGGEGNIVEATKGRLGRRISYVFIGAGAVLLTWTAGTFQIVALASRAFAFYYMLQCLVSVTVLKSISGRLGAAALSVLLLGITLFATPVG